MKLTNRSSKERNQAWNLNTILAVLAYVLSLATALWAIYQYYDSKAKEYHKAFFDERVRIYTELTDTVSLIATLPEGSNERMEAVQRYWRLVFGRVNLVADGEVQEALSKTSKWIVFCVEKKGESPQNLCYDVAGNGYALWVASAARNSIIHTWQLPMRKLDHKNSYLP